MSEEGAKARIAGWLEPIAGASAAGEDARYDPLHEKVRAEAGKLENPASGMPIWDELVRDAESLLTGKSKDLLIASYAACGLWETEGLDGLASGFFLIAETMDRYWDDMFPPARRIRARVNAIDWLIDRVNLTVAETPLGPTDHDAVAALEAGAKRLREVVNARFEDQAPALRTLFDNIERLKLSLPEREEGGASDTEPPPAPDGGAVEPDAGAPAEAGAADAPESVDADGAADAAAEETAPEAPKVDHAAELKALAEPYVAPIAGDNPAGTDAKFEPIYEELRNDVTALDSPTGGDLDWNQGVKKAEKILTDHSKDLLIASYLGWGLFETRSIEGLALGLTILAEICERYWDDCQPPVRRIRGRANALSWFLDRLETPLPEVPVTAGDKAKVERLQVAVKRFIDVVREKFEDAAPSVRPLQDNVQRLLMSVPEPAPEPKKAPEPKPAAEKPKPAAAKPAAPSGGAEAAVSMPSGGATLADPKEVGKFTREISKSLADAAKALREAAPTDPTSYRLVRLGLAIDTRVIPPAQKGSETPAPPPPDIVITNLEAALSNGNHESLLNIAEGTLPTKRFWLDLHRFSAVAMQGLGDAYAAARAEVLAGAAFWVKAFPELLERSFKGGMPFASDVTKEWIAAEVMPTAGGGGGGGGGGGEGAEAIGEAKSLLAGGKLDEALAILDGLAGGARSGRARFRARLAMAQGLASGSGAEAAEGILDGLHREIEARGIEDWDPELAAECYRAHLSCLKSMKKPNDPIVAQQSALVYRRLCRVDPLAALKLG